VATRKNLRGQTVSRRKIITEENLQQPKDNKKRRRSSVEEDGRVENAEEVVGNRK
jgi:hypothetical protein